MRNLYRFCEMLVILCVMSTTICTGQSRAKKDTKTRPSVKDYVASHSGNTTSKYLEYEIVNGDTVYFDVLHYSKVYARLPHQSGSDWRKYYRLVYNFSKTYPYAVAARKIIAEADSIFEAENYKRRNREKYVNELQKKLFTAYEKPMKSMTISQGQLLMKLIDREAGISSYSIIKEYKNGMAAGFWQGIAKLFGTDMKKHYDPEGEDAIVEDLVTKWWEGDFPAYYWALFGEYPKITEVPSNLM